MNLHGIVTPAVSAVNPPQRARVRYSDGYTVDTDGTQIPKYCEFTVDLQVQALTAKELQHLAEMNIQGVTHKIYAYGQLNSVIRDLQKGGDLVTLDCGDWKVVHVFESWPDWSAVGVKRQV